jgi:putative aldouronate transport system permease protein
MDIGFAIGIIVVATLLVLFAVSYILIIFNPFKMPLNIKGKLIRVFGIIGKVILITLLSLFFIIPIWIVLMASFSDSVSFMKEGYSFFTTHFSIEGYLYVFKDPTIIGGLLLSIGVTLLVTVLSVIVNTLAAYVLSEKDLPCHKFLNGLFVFTMLFSTGMVPIVLVIRTIGIYNQFLALVIPGVINVYNILLIRNYLYSIPKSLKEAAIIDGCGQIRIFFKVILPVSLPIIATTAMMAFVLKWNSYLDVMYYISPDNESLRTIQYVIMQMLSDFESSTGDGVISKYVVQSATIIVTMIPLMCVFPFVQKYFEKGLTLGSVKG